MNKYSIICVVDISKDVFDVFDLKEGQQQFSNDPNGFTSFLKALDKEGLVVMEATGYIFRLVANGQV